MPFKKGQSGNPSGRPKIHVGVRDLARECTEDAIKTLAQCVRSKKAPWAARVTASEALLNRGWGRAPQTMDINIRRVARELTDDELHRIASDATGSGNGAAPPEGGAVEPDTVH